MGARTMHLDSPEAWRVIWLVAAVAFAVAEMATPVAFFFLPFAVGAGSAALAAFAGVSVPLEWAVFVAVSASSFGVLWPLGRRLERRTSSHPVGSRRWVGQEAYVLDAIPAGPGATGLVQLERERWRAQSGLTGVAIPAGSTVLVTRVEGARLVVLPLDGAASGSIDPPREGGTKKEFD